MKRSMRWLAVGGVAAAVAVGVTAAVVRGSAGSPSAQAAEPNGYTPSAFVAQLAKDEGVSGLSELVSAGSVDHSVRIVTGQNASGAPCWAVAVTTGGGNYARPFSCGSAPTPDGAVSIFPDVSGPAGSSAATSVILVGLARGDVASVQATLLDGSKKPLSLTDGTFGYAAASAASLPTAVSAYDSAGKLLGEQTIALAGGPECSTTACDGPTP